MMKLKTKKISSNVPTSDLFKKKKEVSVLISIEAFQQLSNEFHQ